NFPGRGEERIDVGGREEIGRTVRAIHDVDLPLAAVARNRLERKGVKPVIVGLNALHQMKRVARAERTPGMTAKLSEGERRTTVHVERHIETAADGEIRSLTRTVDALQLENAVHVRPDREPARHVHPLVR